MSDPVSNEEIEDVLSSIRQLISESAAPERGPASQQGDKLVLTPAFRIHDCESDETDPAPEEAVVQSTSTENSPNEAGSSVLHLVAPVSLPSRDMASDADGAANSTIEVSAGISGLDDDMNTGSPLELTAANGVRSNEADPEVGGLGHEEHDPDTFEERVAELEAAVNETLEIWEPDGGEDTAPSELLKFHASRLHLELVDDDGEREMDELSDEQAQYSELDSLDADEANDDDRSSDRSGAYGGVKDLWEPKETSNDETDILDEEALQALVGRLVRAELQGDVGVKITQSIRRLVRREVERALTLKSFE